MTINSLAPKVLTQNLADREFCLNLGDFWKRPSDRWRLLAKRESRYRSKDGEFSAEKREFITKNSLISVSTQIERISNWISSYARGIRTKTLCLTSPFRKPLELGHFKRGAFLALSAWSWFRRWSTGFDRQLVIALSTPWWQGPRA